MARGIPLVLAAVLGASSVACSGSDDDHGGHTSSLTCGPGKLTLDGDLDGAPVDVELDWTGRSWIQIGSPFLLEVSYPDGQLHLEWTSLTGEGDNTPATGTIQMPSSAPHAGETLCAGDGTLVTDTGDGYGFHLNGLSIGPTCPGTPISGHISGCAGDDPN